MTALKNGAGPDFAQSNPAMFQRMLEFGKRLLAEKDPDKFLALAMDFTMELSGAERGWMMLLKEHGGGIRFETMKNLERKDLETPGFEFSLSVIEKVKADGVPIIRPDDANDACSEASKKLSVICLPLVQDQRMFGFVYLDVRQATGTFAREIFDLVCEFTLFISAAAHGLLEQKQLQGLAAKLKKITGDER